MKAISRNGQIMIFDNMRELWYSMLRQNGLLHGFDYNVSYDNEIATISARCGEGKAQLHSSINNGDVWGIFLKDEYRFLPVREKTVIDIGADIADSSIYFALRGASRIIAIEPFPKNYEIAKQNVSLNDLSDKISILLAGCAANIQDITIDKDHKSNSLSQLQEFETGVKVPLRTLEYILSEYAIPKGSILKMDCEGCEYETILSSSAEILRWFSHIQIEYHFGYKNLKKKLQGCGFKVSFDRPTHWKQNGKSLYTGFVYADQDDN